MSEKTGYPSIDKPWLKTYPPEDLEIKAAECTVWRNIFENNRENLNQKAIRYLGNTISFKELFKNTEFCARTLKAIGIGRGDCVNLCCAGVPEAIYIVLACSKIGAIANFLNPLFSEEQIRDRINDTEAEWIIILDAMYSYVEKALPETCIKNVVIVSATNSASFALSLLTSFSGKARKILSGKEKGEKKYYSWKEFLRFGDAIEKNTEQYEKDTPTIMVYSSGTTGASKGILLTNDGINTTIGFYKRSGFPYERTDNFLAMIPIWFSTGIVFSILMPLYLGITVILEPVFSKESFVMDLKKYMPAITLTATSLWLHAIESKTLKKLNFVGAKFPSTGGEKLLPKDEERINEWLKNHGSKVGIFKGYGMCELGGTVSASSNDVGYVNKLGGCGRPIIGVEVSAFDVDTDEELTYGQHGEIRVYSPAKMKGYYKNPEATAAFFKTDKQGKIWGCTGDIGYVDEDGEVFILGRATDSFRRDNGEIVYLFDIEDIIFKCEEVGQCKVVETEIDGKKQLVAHIVLRNKENSQESALRKIQKICDEALPEHMRPNYYKFRDTMPVHTNGKRDIGALKRDIKGLIK